MKVKNETQYNTVDLRRVVAAVHRQMAKVEGRLPQWKRVVFTVVYTRSNRYCGGWAYVGGRSSRLRVPRPTNGAGVSTVDFVQLVWHEAMHLYGYRHHQYSTNPDDRLVTAVLDDLPVGLRCTLPVRIPRPRVAPTPDQRRAATVARLQARRKAWGTKLKRAQTAVRKLDRQLRYHQQAQAS